MSEEPRYLICPRWPGRNRFADKRKITCQKCPTEVSIMACNLPHLKNITVICEDCGRKIIAEVKKKKEEVQIEGMNLRESGDFSSTVPDWILRNVGAKD